MKSGELGCCAEKLHFRLVQKSGAGQELKTSVSIGTEKRGGSPVAMRACILVHF
jgi:hypothetical protein